MSSDSNTLHDPLDTLCIRPLHASASVSIYDVLCRPHDHQLGPEERPLSHQIVFPRRGVFEFESRGEKLIADANRVLFFNRHEPYRVAHPRGAGDDCTVFAFGDQLLCDALELADPRWLDTVGCHGTSLAASEALAQPFRFVHALSDEHLVFTHERLRRAARSPHREALAIDEAAVELLATALRSGYRARGLSSKPARTSTKLLHCEVVQRTSLFLASAFAEKTTLEDVGRAVNASPFHLARLFRRESGLTIHQYRHRLRLRAALARIADGETDLSALAFELGFSSHSHLTDSFRLAFGMPPAEWRKSLDVERFRKLSRDLEVPRPAKR
jgi:AraC family transcriptional regulator